MTSGSEDLLIISRRIDTLAEQWKGLQRKYGEKQIDLIAKLKLQIQKRTQLNKYKQQQQFILGISFLISLIGFVFWYNRTQKFQDRILKFQHDEYITTQLCQSCGIWLKNLEWFNELTNEEQKKIHFCKTCYNNGEYIEPDITFEQMKQRVKQRCKQLGFNKIQVFFYLKRLEHLRRWANSFRW